MYDKQLLQLHFSKIFGIELKIIIFCHDALNRIVTDAIYETRINKKARLGAHKGN